MKWKLRCSRGYIKVHSLDSRGYRAYRSSVGKYMTPSKRMDGLTIRGIVFGVRSELDRKMEATVNVLGL